MKNFETFESITQFPRANWGCNFGWDYIYKNKDDGFGFNGYNVNTDPDYQRGYVWTQYQKECYIEYRLKGGTTSGREIYFNCPNWNKEVGTTEWHHGIELVDGKQRLNAVISFMNNEVKAFGKYKNQYKDHERLGGMRHDLIFNMNSLATKEEVIEWYLAINSGGSIHTEEDLQVARKILKGLK